MAASIEDVKALGVWMKDCGIARVRLADGTEIDMGAARVPIEKPTPMTPAEREAQRIKDRDKTMFASSSVRPIVREMK